MTSDPQASEKGEGGVYPFVAAPAEGANVA